MDLESKRKWYNKTWITHNLCWLYVAVITAFWDVRNFFIFRSQIKQMAKNPKSKFNQLGLNINSLGNIVYTHKVMDENMTKFFNDRQKMQFLVSTSEPEHSFLYDDLNWREYLITNFIDFTDEETGNVSGYYGVTFTFSPIAINNPRLWRLLLFYIVFFGLILWICRGWIIQAILALWELIKI
jgi:hypothetical protein